MKNKKILFARLAMLIVLAAIYALLTGCASSNGFDGREDIHGLVVDGKNRPVGGFQIDIDKKTYFSNETGLFTIKKIKAGEYRLEGSKSEFIAVDKTITINQKKGLLYIKATSIAEILEEAETSFAEKNWTKAQEILEAAVDGLGAGNAANAVKFYYAMSLFKQKKYQQAFAALESVEEAYAATGDFKKRISEQLRTAEGKDETN
jgi:tetratricopeptide (TPR) repeat protein